MTLRFRDEYSLRLWKERQRDAVTEADSFPPAHAAGLIGLIGVGKHNAGLDGSGIPDARLAILPGTTHYDSFASPMLAPAVAPFLEAPMPEAG